MNATLAPQGNRFELNFAQAIGHPIETVWQAITDPVQISKWMPVQILKLEPRVGGQGRILNPDGSTGLSEVIRFERNRSFGFRAYADGQNRGDNDNIVTFQLECSAAGTLLSGSHLVDQRLTSALVACGWEACFAALDALLADRTYEMMPPSVESFERFTAELGLGQPVVEPIPGGWQIRFERQTLLQPLVKAWNVMTAGLSIREGDFAPPLFTGSHESGRIATLNEPGELEYLTADGGRVRWRLHEHFGSTRFNLTIAAPRSTDPEIAAQTWQQHLEAVIARIIAA